MVRLADLPDYEAAHLVEKDCPEMTPAAWTSPSPAANRRVALITTAGIHCRDEAAFELADATYRVIPRGTDAADIVMSHASVNFDRTGFEEDLNVIFPLERFEEMARTGLVGAVADFHYSFMGAGLLPHQYEETSRSLATLMKREGVNTAFLTPV